MRLGSKLKLYRKRAGYNQIEFAKETGISVATIRRWENGESYPDAAKIVRLAKALGVKPEDLLSDSPLLAIPQRKSDARTGENTKNDPKSLNPSVKLENLSADELGENMLVIEDTQNGVLYKIPATEEGYKLFWNLYLNAPASFKKLQQLDKLDKLEKLEKLEKQSS